MRGMEEMGEGEAKRSLEMGMRAKVRGDVWVNRLTAGRDMIVLTKSKGERIKMN